MSTAPIPLVDLAAQHTEVAADIQAGWQRVVDRTAFVLGDEVAAFEEEFATFSGVAHCVGVANGTDALELALRSLDIGRGDEVLVPVNTFVASALAVVRAGATPVLVDVDAQYQLISVEEVAHRMRPAVRAVMPVHLFGQAAPMRDLMSLAARHGIVVVEDAAQAQGARHDGQPVATFGDVAGTSFYPGKNLGAYGDAGAVLTPSADIAAKVRALRSYGSESKYEHPIVGFNSRLDTLQAVVLRAKLARLAVWNDARRAAAARYDGLLAGVEEVVIPAARPGDVHVWHVYVVRVPERDRVLAALRDAGIGAGVHYPIPLHLQGAFRDLGHRRGEFPVAEAAADEILSLPMFPHITAEQQQRVADALVKALR